MNELHDVLTLDGKPIEMDKVYRCCTWLNALKGVDNLQPLVDYVRDNNLMPDDDICIPGKETVLKLWMRVNKRCQGPFLLDRQAKSCLLVYGSRHKLPWRL